jgi:hypothetical protein
MNHLQNVKTVPLIRPGAIVDDASWTSQVVDTLGWDYATALFQFGAMDIEMAALYMQESDDNSNWTNIAGTIFGTSTNIGGTTSALPINTDDNLVQRVDIDLRGKKRYIKAIATGGNGSSGTYMNALVLLSRGELPGTTAAQLGADELLRV